MKFKHICILMIFMLIATSSAQSQIDSKFFSYSLAISPNGQFLIATTGSPPQGGSIWLYNLEDLYNSPVQLIEESKGLFYGFTYEFSSDSRYFATVVKAQTVVFELETGNQYKLTQGRPVSFINNNEDIVIIFEANHKTYIEIWNIDSKIMVRSFELARLVWISPTWKRLFDFELNHAYKLEFDNGQTDFIRDLNLLIPEYTVAMEYSEDGSLFAFGNHHGGVLLLETETWNAVDYLPLHQSFCGLRLSFKFSPNKKFLVTACVGEKTVSIWNIEESKLSYQATSQGSYLSFSPNGRWLLAEGVDKESHLAYIWDFENNFHMSIYVGLNSVLHPDNRRMFQVGVDGNIWIWDIETEQPLLILPDPSRNQYQNEAE